MAGRVIPIADPRVAARRLPLPMRQPDSHTAWLDQRGRPLRDLRISVTDRCNFRCRYCMPKEKFGPGYSYLPHADLLSFEEIARLARIFVAHGVRKIRLTGGEPLLRKGVEQLIARLAVLRTPEGSPLDLTLTTNGSLLARKAQALRDAGLRRVTVSLDGLDDAVFRRMNDVDFPVADVLQGIEAARQAGLSPIKVNMVVQRGVNDGEIVPMVRHFRGTGVALRFIEYMDVGCTNGWRLDQVVPGAEVIARVQARWALMPLPAGPAGETAQRWGYADPTGRVRPELGEIGLINSVTQAFCSDCNRIRLSTDGRLYTCLFATQGHDLRALLRDQSHGSAPAGDDAVAAAIGALWSVRADRYSELRSQPQMVAMRAHQPRIEMSYIGG